MTHLTARLAWHNDGWNGRICKQPDCNSYCIGVHSFPGDVIARGRNLESELHNADKKVSELSSMDLPPCTYSINAFGSDSIQGFTEPPHFFYGGAARTEWEIPKSTVCVWPYEAMYSDDVYDERGYIDNDRRLKLVHEFFSNIEANKSLIFYYTNYSNPFSEEESLCYALIGVSRVRGVGEHLVFNETNNYVQERFAGGMIWARNVSSHYPNEGLRLPYHCYLNDFETLSRIAVFPENQRICKYGSRLLTDDDAIGLLEQFLNSVNELKALGDDSEDWDERERWLLNCIADLWGKRGLYPGLLNVMRYLSADKATKPARSMIEEGRSKDAHRLFFEAIENGAETPELELTGNTIQSLRREWRLQPDSAQMLLRDVLSRFNLDVEQIKRIVSEESNVRKQFGLPASVTTSAENPYLLCESYVGDNPDDTIPWATIDRGVLPSPELGGSPLAEMSVKDARRLRALCVERLRLEPNQTFRAADVILEEVNTRLATLPNWKSTSYTKRHFEVDRDVLEEAMVLRTESDRLYLYLKDVYDDERSIENTFAKLNRRSDIALKRPFSQEDWRDEICDSESPLLKGDRERYEQAIDNQVKACSAIFQRPFSVVTGAAGTGKTSIIRAIIQAVRQTEGDGTALYILAPTGKASDRVRAKLHEQEIDRVAISTVHSFLAKGGWLNKNLTFKRIGGRRTGSGTIIIDEASMLDLSLMACLVRAIDWNQVRRLILVGDPNQLPPIGRGRVFADTIQWLTLSQPDGIGQLTHNLRQLESAVEGNESVILRLANLFISSNAREGGEATSDDAEELLTQVHKSGDIGTDLRVVYWDDSAKLSELLVQKIEKDMEVHTKEKLNHEKPYRLWYSAFDRKPARYQVLTPHRGELHGVESLNNAIQNRVVAGVIQRFGCLDGITLYDKVIQFRNRPQSDPIWAYNFKTRRPESVEVFNGEIGFVSRHNFDRNEGWYRLKRFQVNFERKEHLAVGYGSELSTNGAREKVEENLELAYAISVHKAQGSEFDYTYIVLPRLGNGRSLSSELLYTALTRASRHCTLLIQGDVSTLLSARRVENTQSSLVNSSLFQGFFRAVPDELSSRKNWYEEGKIHEALCGDMVRSKSELVIANLLHEREIPFSYEVPLIASDGTMYLPDFTITWQGEKYFWEHWGMSSDTYIERRARKTAWYENHFPGRLIQTFEGPNMSLQADQLVNEKFI